MLFSVKQLFVSLWTKSIRPLNVKPGMQRLEKGSLPIFQAIGNIPLERFKASMTKHRQQSTMELGLFFSVTKLLYQRKLNHKVLSYISKLPSKNYQLSISPWIHERYLFIPFHPSNFSYQYCFWYLSVWQMEK